MAVKLRDMSVEQFRGLVRDTMKQVLRELLEDPDAGLALQPAFVRRLRRSLAHLEKGGKTVSAEDMAKRLDRKKKIITVVEVGHRRSVYRKS